MDPSDPDRLQLEDALLAAFAVSSPAIIVLVWLCGESARLSRAVPCTLFPATPLALALGLGAGGFLVLLGGASILPRRWRGPVLHFLAGTALPPYGLFALVVARCLFF